MEGQTDWWRNARMDERMEGPRDRQAVRVLCKPTSINKTQRYILKCKSYGGNV